MPYLTADEVRATVAQIAELSAPAGQLVVNYQTKSRQRPSCGVAMPLVLRVSRQHDPLTGEPWRSKWRPDRMRSMLRQRFRPHVDSDLLTLSEGLAQPPNNKGSLRNGRVAVAVHR